MDNNYTIYSKLITDETLLLRKLSAWRFKNKKIIFSNGCFDILHRGHVEYLYKASLLGDILVLGLNTDKSVQKIKGPKRPVVDQQSRAIVLSALEFVDAIVFFDEDTPYNLIKTVQPDILIKGDDYKPEDIVGADIVEQKGGKIKTIPLTEGFSTSQLIEKLKNK